MQPRTRNILVGLFVLVGLVILGWLIIAFGTAPHAFSDTFAVRINLPTAGSLMVADTVKVNGVQVGQVAQIKPRDQFLKGVTVTVDIRGEHRIPRRVSAVVHSPQMGLGKASISLVLKPDARANELLRGGDVIEGQVLSGLEALVGAEPAQQFETLISSLNQVSGDLHQLLQPRSTSQVDSGQPDAPLANLSTAVQRMDATFRHFDQLLAANRGNVDAVTDNLRQASANVKALTASLEQFANKAVVVADKADATFTTANAELKKVGESLAGNSAQLANALDKLNRALEDVNQGKGTVGKLFKDPALYDNILLASDRLQSAITELQKLIAKWQAEGVQIKLK